MLFSRRRVLPVLLLANALLAGELVQALTMDELRRMPNLTPESLASRFARFQFRFQAAVQAPEDFLKRRKGDCDDFAILAAEVLAARGYTPRLIAVRMPSEVHVVCYIEETGRYLDYNLRKSARPSVESPGAIEEIAARVARSFRQPWSSASEFTFQEGRKYLVETVWFGELNRPLLVEKSEAAPASNSSVSASRQTVENESLVDSQMRVATVLVQRKERAVSVSE